MQTKPLKGRRKVCRPHSFFRRPLKGLLLCLLVHTTRKRVYKFFQLHLISDLISRKLLFYVFLYLLFVSSYCVYIISSCPEMSISILVFQIGVPVKNHQATFSFPISHDLRYTILWRYRYQHVYVVGTKLRFNDFYAFLLT